MPFSVSTSGPLTTPRAHQVRAGRSHALRLAVACATIAASACAPGVTPLPPSPSAPVPEVAPPVVVRATRAMLPATHDTAHYDVESRTTLTRDSAGVPLREEVRLSAQVAFALQRLTAPGAVGADVATRTPRSLRGTGRVDGFLISATDRVERAGGAARPGMASVAPNPSIPMTVPFDAMLDGLSARVVPRPPLANECDRREMTAVALARELFVRMPAELVVGGQWTDTARVFMCRGGVPVTVQSYAVSTMQSLDDGPLGASTVAVITRTLTTRVEGSLATAWRTVGITGQGTGTQRITVDVTTGMLQQLRGTSDLTLDVRDSARPDGGRQSVLQHVELTADRQSAPR